MKRLQFAKLIARLPRLARRRDARSIGAVVLGLGIIGLLWLAGSSRHGDPGGPEAEFKANRSDLPTWRRMAPQWPAYMPRPERNAQPLGTATATSAVSYAAAPKDGMPTIDAPLTDVPTVAAGPELFAPPRRALPPPMAVPMTATIMPPQSVATGPRPAWPAALPPTISRFDAAAALPLRSEAMEKIAVQSDRQIRHGFDLADRGAYFAARAEFTAALRIIAQGLDDSQNTSVHSQALRAALTAIREAEDFVPAGGKIEADLDLPAIVARHRTPVLKDLPSEQLQAMRALNRYFTFAQNQLALAGGQEVSASMALDALGKMHAALAGKPGCEIVAPEAKAITFLQASLLVYPRNYMTANDLGVLLAHSGDLAGARRALEHSVLVCRSPENLGNLSAVYRQMGESRLAGLAAEKAEVARATEIARQKNIRQSAGGTVQWVDPTVLAQSTDQWNDPAKPAPVGPQDKAIVGMAPAPFAPTTAH